MSDAIRAALVVLATVMATAPASAANLIANGNFENTGFGGTGGYYNVPLDHPIPADFGWSVPVNNVDIIANGVYTPYLASGGAYSLDLVGYGSTGAISQSFATSLGKTYKLSLDYSQNGSGNTADVILGSTTLATLVAAGVWQSYSTSFVGTGSPITLTFSEGLGGGNAGVALDNIWVTEVPEPASWALLLAGFGMVGFALRTRRATAAT